jgi:hypothetical protein
MSELCTHLDEVALRELPRPSTAARNACATATPMCCEGAAEIRFGGESGPGFPWSRCGETRRVGHRPPRGVPEVVR